MFYNNYQITLFSTARLIRSMEVKGLNVVSNPSPWCQEYNSNGQLESFDQPKKLNFSQKWPHISKDSNYQKTIRGHDPSVLHWSYGSVRATALQQFNLYWIMIFNFFLIQFFCSGFLHFAKEIPEKTLQNENEKKNAKRVWNRWFVF